MSLSTSRLFVLQFLCITAFLAGCLPPEPLALRISDPAYGLAQGCYVIRAGNEQHYLVANDGTYAFAQTTAEAATKFFIKPARLGEFLLHDNEARLLALDGYALTRQSAADAKAVWKIDTVQRREAGEQMTPRYALLGTSLPLRLHIADGQTRLRRDFSAGAIDALVAESAALEFIAQDAAQCAAFPEAALDAVVSEAFYTPRDPAQPVVGYADLHTHIGFPKSIAGVAMSGDVFHPYGIPHALGNCAEVHGENGKDDLLEANNSSNGAAHATDGYPTFSAWPNRFTNTHVQAYYRWIERAHLSGLKLMVTDVTGNPTFCQILSLLHFGKAESGCSAIDEVQQQTQYIYDLQDYIDAQNGGPGRGWFRIVTSPAQARQVIAANKLAVVLGVEHGELFDCRESNTHCTPDYIDQKVAEIHALGIRSVFPIHRFDNAFGGTHTDGSTSGGWMHLSSRLSTSSISNLLGDLFQPDKFPERIDGHFWEVEACPGDVHEASGIDSMEAFFSEDFDAVRNILPGLGDVLDVLFVDKLRPLPTYAEFAEDQQVCNKRGLQDIGRHLVNRLIDRKMIVEIDHVSHYTLMDMLDIFEQRQYSGIVSSHSWIEDSDAVRERIYALGGVLSPMKSNPTASAAAILHEAALLQAHGLPVGVTVSTDIQGVTSQAEADAGVRIQYPFASVDGTVTFTAPKTGARSFDYASEGVAHYGMLAEWLENLRQVDAADDADIMGIFMNSAESYLQMWERTQAHAD